MKAKFPEYKQLDLTQISNDILNQWKEKKTFQESVNSKEGKDNFVFFEGPPSANGKPGIHHVLSRTIKDIFCRFQTLKGKKVIRKAGWDTHGLPIELGVEKELGITKEDIGKTISVEEYNMACKKAVMRYTHIWNDLTEKMGYWVDLEKPYVTFDSKYMESIWWLLKQMYNKNLLYKGYTIQPYSPKAGTGLSSHELNMPGAYKDITDTTIVAQFKAKKESTKLFDSIENDVYFLAWTTTPWTLPSNTALTLGKKIDYILVETFNQYTFDRNCVIIAKKLLSKMFGKLYFEAESEIDLDKFESSSKKIPYQILQEFKGKELVGIQYEQLLPWAKPYKNSDKAFRVIDGKFVTTEDGTGIVHTAPTFGADDAVVAKKHGISPMLILDKNQNPVPLVDLQGKFVDQLPEPFGGRYIKNEFYREKPPEKSTDVLIAIQLKEENKAFKVEKYKHNYPHCWRTDKPILYYPLDSWFIKVTQEKEKMVKLNQQINWKPKSTGEGRFGKWLENANDWNLSRSRFWGTPLPIWCTEDRQEEICIGSVEELIQQIEVSIEKGFMQINPFAEFKSNDMSDKNYETIDLHKNIVDKIILSSPTGKPMHRESDLIDVWFDSGSMPYAQYHYPFENKEFIENNQTYPADFIAEGVDQTRGWFYTMHAISSMVFDQIAYKNVVSNGLVLDKKGQKMSKRLNNAVNPFETLEKYGPDATRWYMISNAQPWENLKFDIDGIDEVKRKFFGTLYNTYSFYALYANVDGFKNEQEQIPVDQRSELDQWILSELHSLIKEVNHFYSDYEPTRVTRAIQKFVVDNLSNWYIRLSRRRFWKGQIGKDKVMAYQTLHTVLETVAILSAPIAPFFMDRLYQDLAIDSNQDNKSVHLANFPKVNEALIQEGLQDQTHLAQLITTMVLSLRKQADIKVRQPLQKIMIPVLNKETKTKIDKVSALLMQELNIKNVQTIDSKEASHLLVKQIKPNFKALGPKHGKDMKSITKATAKLAPEQISELEQKGWIDIKIESGTLKLELEDFEISTKDIPGWTVASNNTITVALDLHISEELEQEGIARELVNRIQNLRKENGLEVTDKIHLSIENQEKIEKSVNQNKNYICTETLTNELIFTNSLDAGTEILVNDLKTKILIEKI